MQQIKGGDGLSHHYRHRGFDIHRADEGGWVINFIVIRYPAASLPSAERLINEMVNLPWNDASDGAL